MENQLLDSYNQQAIAGPLSNMANEQQEFNLFAMLKPKIYLDGNHWCVLYGENLQEGISGFGESPRQAILDFNSQWYKKVSPVTPQPGE